MAGKPMSCPVLDKDTDQISKPRLNGSKDQKAAFLSASVRLGCQILVSVDHVTAFFDSHPIEDQHGTVIRVSAHLDRPTNFVPEVPKFVNLEKRFARENQEPAGVICEEFVDEGPALVHRLWLLLCALLKNLPIIEIRNTNFKRCLAYSPSGSQ
jgi:hypothetical protein